MTYTALRPALALALTLTAVACAPRAEEEAAAAPPPAPLATEAIVSWNAAVLAAAEAEDGFLTLKGLRSAAMMHLAMHDALNAIHRRYETYLAPEPSPEADATAALCQAGYTVAAAQYPADAAGFAERRDRCLATVEDGVPRTSGLDLGTAAAEAVLATREDDGWDSEAEYEWHPMAPGVYAEFQEHSGTPDGFVFGAGWAIAEPFLLPSPDHFRSPPPPEISSAEYSLAYDEVREVGRFESASRTDDQTHLAMWWKEFAEKSHNRLARELVTADRLGAWPTARLFALLNASIYDAYVNVFDNKFHYNHWRPYTAIRWAANDGNPDTAPEPDWDNTHRHTYAFPSYPSAHGTACAAAATVLADTLGEDRSFTMTIREVDSAGPFSEKIAMDPPTRSFDSFSEAAMECALSRVYLGIHFRYDSIVGNELGGNIGSYALQHHLRPLD